MKFLKKKQKGFTLVEILMTTGIFLVVSGGLYALYKLNSETNDALEETKRIVSYVTAAESSAETSGNFSQINIPYYESIGVEVDRKMGLTEIISPDPRTLEFRYSGVSSIVCSRLATNMLAANMKFATEINGTQIVSGQNVINQISESCAQPSSTMVFRVRSNLDTNTLTDPAAVGPYDYGAGNPGSLVVNNWGTSPDVPTYDGSSYSSVGSGVNGSGFTGGTYVIGSSTTPPVHSTVPPLIGNGTGDPYQNGGSVTVPVTEEIVSADLSIVVGSELTPNVFVDKVGAVVTGMEPGKDYRIEFSSHSFNLQSTTPVIMGSEVGLAEELTTIVTPDSIGVGRLNINQIMDISEYFNPEVAISPSLRNFFTSTMPGTAISVDLYNVSNNNFLATLSILPKVIVLPPVGTQFTDNILICGPGDAGYNAGPSDIPNSVRNRLISTYRNIATHYGRCADSYGYNHWLNLMSSMKPSDDSYEDYYSTFEIEVIRGATVFTPAQQLANLHQDCRNAAITRYGSSYVKAEYRLYSGNVCVITV